MTTESRLRSRYADVLEDGDDAAIVRILADLEGIFPARTPPRSLSARIAGSQTHHTPVDSGSRLLRTLTAMRCRRRSRLSLAAVSITVAGLALATSGLGTAAMQTIQERLWSSPPPSAQAGLWVGSLEPPLWGGCAPHTTTSPIADPDGRRFAQLRPVPVGVGGSVSVTFPPCMPRPLRPGSVPPKQPSNLKWENITIVSVVQYRGPSGMIEVTTARATDEGMRRGLYLGNPVGTLGDGSRAFTLTGDVRWVADGLIISVSGNASLDELKSLASDVVLT